MTLLYSYSLASKYQIMRIQRSTKLFERFYNRNKEVLEQVVTAKYLVIMITEKARHK